MNEIVHVNIGWCHRMLEMESHWRLEAHLHSPCMVSICRVAEEYSEFTNL